MLCLDGLSAKVIVYRDDNVLGKIEHTLQVAGRQVKQQAQPAGIGLAEPDVGHRRGQPDVPHALPSHLGPRHLDAASVADYSPVPDALVLAAEALPVLGGSEQPLAEQAVFLRPQRAVIDGLRLGYLAVRPAENLIRRCNGDAYGVEIGRRGLRPVCHSDHIKSSPEGIAPYHRRWPARSFGLAPMENPARYPAWLRVGCPR